jgi:hypothetical protein
MSLSINQFVTPQRPANGYAQFNSGDPQNNWVNIYTGGPNGSRINSLSMTTNDASGQEHQVSFRIYRNTAILYTITIAVSVSSGYDGIPAQPLINPSITTGLPVDQYGNQYLHLMAGDTLDASYNGALPSGCAILFYAIGADF